MGQGRVSLYIKLDVKVGILWKELRNVIPHQQVTWYACQAFLRTFLVCANKGGATHSFLGEYRGLHLHLLLSWRVLKVCGSTHAFLADLENLHQNLPTPDQFHQLKGSDCVVEYKR
jgi:hypothetical protein